MHNLPNRIWRRLARYFIAGLLIVLPVVVTIGIVIWVAEFVHRLIGPGTAVGNGLQSLGLHFVTNNAAAYAIGWAVVLACVFGLGMLGELGAKRFLVRMLDAGAKRIPIIGNIYRTSNQLVTLFDQHGESEIKSMQVVWCFFGKEGGAGILALMPTPDCYRVAGREYNAVIIPTAPVPFGGALVFVPTECVQKAEMSVDGLLSIYVSMGVTTPQFVGTGATENKVQS